MYFNIQRFSTHDGDGIRTILFLKGCSLSCPWCQNPESRSAKHSLLFDERSCMADCQLCVSAYKQTVNGDMASDGIRHIDDQIIINRKAMSEAQIIALRNVCPTQALSICGEAAKSDDLFEVLMKDKPFYDQSQGGVTFSGGEPLMQPSLVAELAERLHQNHVSTAVESCMHVPWKNVEKVAPYIDCWLADLKHTDEEKFLCWAKGSLKRIKDNFRKLAPIAKRIVIRIPVVPGFNDTIDELKAIIDFAASLESCQELHLLPYHTLGINKYRLLDMPYECSDKPLNNPELLENAMQYASEHTQLNVIVRG
ncbi:glycyl-radical enzyme activating protein [Vibrio parahaemolyticus]|uniref:glycyl-radical enzyme activating protein n=1 Tax=Vibrio parahaemolyticus TaxID=670 RepID=UPI000415958C|nr:glycyl-radical enzyme activating protein [Vibrio parahaemolyticus]ELB2916671.1 glycyl-radical enzyme activating protein [Vibrio parahaemolyticus]MBE3921024.1 glycyl-radical enzyme activating protein [Vibrio parahaemolyticus]MCR9854717.1 glycyl-radical enzyme activating protein [Vibrio parahaemolyticus]HCE3065963.1 glycyl-radical enzyme activating protein [Vibrio parahaemolyticus]HCM0865892.1 glycyl-radical enzyme activating protein [Vibrio parahaemolyticus]